MVNGSSFLKGPYLDPGLKVKPSGVDGNWNPLEHYTVQASGGTLKCSIVNPTA